MTETNVTELRPSPHKGEGVTARRTRPARSDRTNAERQRRFKRKRALAAKGGVTTVGNQNIESPQNVATVASLPQVTPQGNAIDVVEVTALARETRGVTPVGRTSVRLATSLAATCLATVGVTLSLAGMVETATYALAVGGVLFCAQAIAADLLALTMPSVMAALWHRRSPAVILAGALWCAGGAVTVANLAGYVGEHVEQYQVGRETLATGRGMALERLARLKDERKAITETRPPAAIAAALNDARRSERPALREAQAMARRRDALDVELAVFEQQLGDIPQVATADASAAVLSDISGTTVSEHELRRLRLALLLGLPLCSGLVLSLAFAFTAASARGA
jgi:hypothetical protein